VICPLCSKTPTLCACQPRWLEEHKRQALGLAETIGETPAGTAIPRSEMAIEGITTAQEGDDTGNDPHVIVAGDVLNCFDRAGNMLFVVKFHGESLAISSGPDVSAELGKLFTRDLTVYPIAGNMIEVQRKTYRSR
jgi:hypothetical protein